MDSFQYRTPDLASILQTLSRFGSAPTAPPTQTSQSQPADRPITDDDELEDGEYDPAELVLQPQQQARPAPAVSTASHPGTPVQPRSLSQQSNILRPAIGPDISSIIDWPSGLRCVMRTVARTDASIVQIRKMVQVQHQHEQQWWEGRQALLNKQRARLDGKKRLDDVLRAVGSTAITTSDRISTPEDDARELATYDAKVYSASREMFAAAALKLAGLGVPFFATRASLVFDDDDEGDAHRGTSGIDDESSSAGGRITKKELQSLQLRMLELLEDMCKE
ncbi:MAG: hypothetical protein M1825_001207 [Sarcosagium campestre]|nr:MAG: hypothetical protein M1825_001207 [Sarcosagium campestre]